MATAPIQNNGLKDQILDLSRQNQIGELSPFMSALLDKAIEDGYYPDEFGLETINDRIIDITRQYREQTGRDTVILGMSGGVDSALTAAIFKKAGYRVIGVTMPIYQDESETQRGVDAILALGLEHIHMDLTDLYDQTLLNLATIDSGLMSHEGAVSDTKDVKIRKGNIRARLRMVTLYNLANAHHAFVASTDNLSELGAGFWTLHGDVGDYSPIQALLKSWEVPYLARLNGVPEDTVRAKPTDGLGIDAGDEAQLGCSYLEWDLMTYALATGFAGKDGAVLNEDRAEQVHSAVVGRMGATWFKRRNPLNVPHALEDRYGLVDGIDRLFFVPECFKNL